MNAAEAFGQYLALTENRAADTASVAARVNAAAAKALPGLIDSFRSDRTIPPACRPENSFAPDYGVNLGRMNMGADTARAFRCGVPLLASHLVVTANDVVHIAGDNEPRLTVSSIRDLSATQADRACSLIEKYALTNADSAVGALLMHDGIYIHVAAGAKIEKPVQIVSIFNSPVDMLTPRCVIVDAEAGAQVKVLLCDHAQSADRAHLAIENIIVEAAEDSHIELYDIEESSEHTHRNMNMHVSQQHRSTFNCAGIFLNGGTTLNRYKIEADGNETHTGLCGLAICTGNQTVANDVVLVHKGKHGTSKQLFKNALFDNARGSFGGRVVVSPGAAGTDAVQTNRNILDSEEARMETSPQLEIYCDEVKCSHGATTGRLDERAMFYMQSRGIPQQEARRMLTQAFMADVIDNIDYEVLRQRLHILVEKRLSGAPASCESCATACKGINSDQ